MIQWRNDMGCKHNDFFESLGDIQSNREYWLITEFFVYLHEGKDFCNCDEQEDLLSEYNFSNMCLAKDLEIAEEELLKYKLNDTN